MLTALVASLMSQRLLLGLHKRYERMTVEMQTEISSFAIAPGDLYTDDMEGSLQMTVSANIEADWLISFRE